MRITEGMKSSEFWLTLIFTAVAILCKVLLGDKCPFSMESIPLAIGAYALSRGLAKRGV